MKDRVLKICAAIPPCSTLADVGCDHGLCAAYALREGLCERVYITDVSAKCLHKAEVLLAEEIAAGRCIPIVCDGLEGLPETPDGTLIAGLGGEEIVRILQNAVLPRVLVLQPMKNAEKVRALLLEKKRRIVRDYTFASGGKFYDLIVSEGEGREPYTDLELAFGRDNLTHTSPDFSAKLTADMRTLRAALSAPMQRETREELLKKLNTLEEIFDATQRT